jgi:oxalate decarboxylase
MRKWILRCERGHESRVRATQGTVPTNTVAQDQQEIGGSAVAAPTQNTFRLKSMTPARSAELGEVRIVDSRNFPLTKLAAALVTLKPGGLRELHWHPNASEWQFWIAGQGRMTVFFPRPSDL